MTTTLENLMESVGGFGRFQFLLIPLSMSSILVAAWSMLFMVFGAVQPHWWCLSRDVHNQSYPHLGDDTHGTFVGDEVFLDGEDRAIRNQTNVSLTEAATHSCAALIQGDETCQTIAFAPGMSTIVTEFHLVCDRAWIPSMTISLQMVGVLFGASLGGQLGDTIGRKKSMVIVTAVHAILNLIAAFSITWQMFVVLRTLLGLTIGAILVVSYSYPMEFVGVKWRSLIGTLPFWGMAGLTCSLLIWALPDWSHVHIATAVCTAACLPAWIIFLPESVRWLTVQGRVEETEQVLHQMAKWNRRKVPDLSSVQSLFSDTEKSHTKYNYLHIFSTRLLVRVSVLSGFMWFCTSMTYYGITFGIKNLSGDFNLNFFLMALVEAVSSLPVYHLSAWLGRRWATFWSYLLVGVILLAVIPVSLLMSEEEAGNYVNAMCIVGKFCIIFGWSLITVLHSELYPTVIRNLGMGYCNTVARVGGIVAPYILSVGEPYVFYAIIGVSMILSALSPLLLPETRGRPLMDEITGTPTHDERLTNNDNEHELKEFNA